MKKRVIWANQSGIGNLIDNLKIPYLKKKEDSHLFEVFILLMGMSITMIRLRPFSKRDLYKWRMLKGYSLQQIADAAVRKGLSVEAYHEPSFRGI